MDARFQVRAEYRTCGEGRNGTRRVAGDEHDQDLIRQTSCQGSARVTRCVGTAVDTTRVCAASALAGLEAAGSDVRKRNDASVLQGPHRGREGGHERERRVRGGP